MTNTEGLINSDRYNERLANDDAAAASMLFKSSPLQQPAPDTSVSKNRRISFLVGMVFGLLAIMCVVSIVGAIQMGKIQREVKRIASEVVPFTHNVSAISLEQLRFSLEVDRALSRVEMSVDAGRPVSNLALTLEDLKARSRVIDLRYSEGESLLDRVLPDVVEEGERQELAHLKALLLRLEGSEQHYERTVFDALEQIISASGPRFDELSREVVFAKRKDIALLQREIEQRSTEIFAEAQAVLESAITKAARHQRNAKLAMAICAGLSLIVGVALIFRLRNLQRDLIRSEQMTVLARTLVTLHHEINNPLAVIVGNAQLLQCSNNLNPEQQEMLSTVQGMAMRVKEVLQKLSSLESVAFTKYVGKTEMLKIEPETAPQTAQSSTSKGPKG